MAKSFDERFEDKIDQLDHMSGKELKKEGMKLGWKILLWVIVLSVLGLIFRIVMFPLFVANTAVKSAEGVIEKTLDPNNVLQNYEWFKQENMDYVAIVQKIKTADEAVNQFKIDAGDRKSWTFEDKNEMSRLQSIATGLRYQANDIVAQYNAKSQMQNRNLFKTKDLPDHLDQVQ